MSDVIKNYSCPCCGGGLVFNPSEQKLNCEACGNSFTPDTMEQLDELENAKSSKSTYNWENYHPRSFEGEGISNLSTYTCPSCGASITGDDTAGSTVCPYCGNAVVIKKQFSGALMPDYIIPFKVDKALAMTAFEEACKKAPFLPDEFKNKKKIEEMTGVYIPFWMFDCDCDGSVSCSAEKVSVWSDNKYDYVKTDYYRLLRAGNIAFANIPVDGSQKADNTYMEAIEPYNCNEAVEFNTAYLSGYFSDRYDVTADESIERANERIKNSTESALLSSISGYSSVLPSQTTVNFSNGKIRYSLLPVWMLNIKYNGEMFKYAINGQTGKVAGVYPVSKRKRNIYFAKIYATALVITVLLAVLYFMIF